VLHVVKISYHLINPMAQVGNGVYGAIAPMAEFCSILVKIINVSHKTYRENRNTPFKY